MKNTADEVIAQLLGDKKLNLQKGNSEVFNYTRIPFGIPALDKLTGGGIPKKRMTIMYGPTNVGKSYLASQVVANVQRDGGTAAWIDTELSWDSEWVEKCGIDSERMLVSQPTSGEEALGTAKELMRAGIDVIVLDSIAGLVPSDVQDNEKGFEFSPMAWQARFVNSALPRLLPNLKSGSAFIAINQVRSSIGPVALDTMPGGLAQSFFAHFLLQVRRSGWIEEPKGTKVGFDMEVRLRKSKVGGENWSNAIVPFRVDGGIDVLESYIREAIQQKLITQKGAWYDYEGLKAMGMNGLKTQLLNNPTLVEKLKADVT
jgi:recombination protein RecA